MFERCSASVVHINTFVERQGIVLSPQGYHLGMQDIPKGTGSGFAWDSEHIVTNFHVIMDAHRATVVLSDHTSCEATLVGAEPDCDLAVLKINRNAQVRKPLLPLDKGRSSNLHVGQRVYAIGNPFGLDQTLTTGLVSGLGREMNGVSGRTMRGLIQTDAAINPGNSGGPLLDSRGRLIGVNTMIASPSGAFAGVGFAIPVDTVVRVVTQLVKFGYTKHAHLGIFPLPDHMKKKVSPKVSGSNGRNIEGVLVLKIVPGSPADKAGLEPMYQTARGDIRLGDEILAIDGKKVSTTEDLVSAIEDHSIGDRVTLSYFRHEVNDDRPQQRSVEVTLTERPGQHSVQASGNGGSSPHSGRVPISEFSEHEGRRSRL